MIRLAATVFVVVLGCAACGGHSTAPGAPASRTPVAAAIAPVQPAKFTIPYEAVGSVRSRASSTIQSKIVGHVTAVHVKEGDLVETGQLLVEIDNREAAAQEQKAQSALNESQQALDGVEKAAAAAQQAEVAASARYSLAKSDFDRIRQLAEQNATSRQKLDEAEAQFKGASASLQEATETARSYLSKKAEVMARIEQARAEIENMRAGLSFTKLTSPLTGIITRKSVEVGDLAAPGVPLLEVEDRQNYRLEALVDEGQIHRMHTGDKVAVMIDALGQQRIDGSVTQIVPSAEQNSRTFVVKIDLPANEGLRSGMFGRAEFTAGEKEVLAVPAAAVVTRGQLTGVYAVGGDNVARWRLITVGKRQDAVVEVLSGLREGEEIVTDHLEQIGDGTPIQR